MTESFDLPPPGGPLVPLPREFWRCDGSRVDLRGPAPDPGRPFLAVLGSSEAPGRFVPEPLPDLLAQTTRLPVLDLTIHNGGPDVYLRDPGLMRMLGRAEVAVIQLPGAHLLSNPFYTVHPRRNDRFLRETRRMRAAFPRADFTDYVFVRHLVGDLRRLQPDRFDELRAALRAAWTERMRALIRGCGGKVVLVWIEDAVGIGLGPEPLFVTTEMLEEVRRAADKLVHFDATGLRSEAALEEMAFAVDDLAAARLALPPMGHEEVARRVVRAIVPMLQQTRLRPGGGPGRRGRVA